MPRFRCSSTRLSLTLGAVAVEVPTRWANPAVIRPNSAFPTSNSDQPGLVDQLPHVAGPVDQRQQPLLLGRERRGRLADVLLVDREDQVEGGDLLLDQAPLVDPPGALEQQALRD